jgi:hypothetical protein
MCRYSVCVLYCYKGADTDASHTRVQILCQPAGNAAAITVAKQAIKIEELPWNSEGQVPAVLKHVSS